jgi:hypothetical protein
MEQYEHIQIERQDLVPHYRGHSNPNIPRPPIRDKIRHGEKLRTELAKTSASIIKTRKDIGIQSDNLMVMEIGSDSLSNELLELMVSKFGLYLVEETEMDSPNCMKLIVQFPGKRTIEVFDNERKLWETDDKEDAVLTYAQRRDLFDCIDEIRTVSSNDRLGNRLKNFMESCSENLGFFIVNIDVWYNNDITKVHEIENQIKEALGTQGSQLLGDLFKISGLLLGRAKVNEFSLKVLLNMDIISHIELPLEKITQEPYALYSDNYKPIINDKLNADAPMATVLDSGVFTGNPLLRRVVVAENDFDHKEQTTTDLNGHGTGVAGIVVYGDFTASMESRVFTPLVRICNGKIMHNELDDYGENCPCFSKDVRIEKTIKEAITYFYEKYGCRIFNLSIGNIDNLYDGGRQFPCASMLDDLSRELDIVIIVSAGNVSSPVLDEFSSRENLMENIRDQLFSKEHKLIDPATSALSVTVGSITRFAEPSVHENRITLLSAGCKDYPSVFTRIGKGVNKAIKPEFVDYGGNFAVNQMGRAASWVKNDRKLMEPTLNNTTSNIFKGYCGTSFSAPHVTHMAARIERSLEKQLGAKPSANLIRAMLANSAQVSESMVTWGKNSKDKLYQNRDNPKQERFMRLNGYGIVTERLLASTDNCVTLFAEDALPLRDFHIYKIPFPKEFLKIKAEKSITVSLAYNPMTRSSRKEYLSNNLWMEIFRRIDESELLKYKAKREAGVDTEEDLHKMPNAYKIDDFIPGFDTLQKSTLQQRRWKKGIRGGSDLQMEDNTNPHIYVLISGKERFKYETQEIPQPYALCITFSYDSEENIDLYNQVKARVKQKVIERVQERIRV